MLNASMRCCSVGGGAGANKRRKRSRILVMFISLVQFPIKPASACLRAAVHNQSAVRHTGGVTLTQARWREQTVFARHAEIESAAHSLFFR